MKLINFYFCSKMLKTELNFIRYILNNFESHNDNNILYYEVKNLLKDLKVTEEKLKKDIDALLSKKYYYEISFNGHIISGKFTFLSSYTLEDDNYMFTLPKEVIENFIPDTAFYESDLESFFCLKNNKSVRLLLEIYNQKKEGKSFYISLDNFKDLLNIETEYKRFYDFERFVLQEIIEDINRNSFIKVTYNKVKKGNSLNSKVEGLTFFMLDKKQKLLTEETNELLELIKYRIKDISTIYHLIRSSLKKHGYNYVKMNLALALDKKGRALDIIVIRSLKENWAKVDKKIVGQKSLKLLFSDSSFFNHYETLLYHVYNQFKILGMNPDFNRELRRQMEVFKKTKMIDYEDNKYKINVRYHEKGRSNIRIYSIQ